MLELTRAETQAVVIGGLFSELLVIVTVLEVSADGSVVKLGIEGATIAIDSNSRRANPVLLVAAPRL